MAKNPNEMTFFEHLDELRSVLFVCIAGFGVAALGSIIFYKTIFKWLQFPLELALQYNPDLQALNHGALTSLHFMDPFSILIYIALLGGFVISSPVVLYQIGKFIVPALSNNEQKNLVPVCASATFLFLLGAGTAFFVLAPLSINFMYFFAGTLGLEVNWLAADYYAFIVLITLFVGLLFEFPLIVIALQYFETVSTKTLLEKWRYVVAGLLIAVAFISPISDPIALLVLTGALFLLYIASVFIGNFLVKRKTRSRKTDFSDGDLHSLD